MSDRLNDLITLQVTTTSTIFQVEETAETLVIKGTGYGLTISRQAATMELDLNGRQVATLNVASGLDTTEAIDEATRLDPPTFYFEPEGVVVSWRGSSQVWASKQVELRAWAGGFTYGYSVEGAGAIDRAHFFRTHRQGSLNHAVRLFNPEPNSGPVHYSGERCEPGNHCVMCLPNPQTGKIEYTGPADFMTITVGKDKDYHEGNWFFTPSPFCLAVEGENNWLSLGMATEPGEWNFSDMVYPDQGFGFSLVYDGHVQVQDKWQSPRLLCLVAEDEYKAVELYCDTLRELGLVPNQGRGPRQAWWQEPIFCGWGEQVSQEVHSGLPKAPDRSTQANYEQWLATLEAHNLNPGIVVLDDRWQHKYGLNSVDLKKWPDMPSFIARQHQKGRHVLLWLKAWDAEGVPPEECIVDQDGRVLSVDPGNPAYRQRFTQQIHYMLQELGADGFKIDFTHLIPRLPAKIATSKGGRWGLELMRQWLEIVSEATRAAKPEAVIIAHTANPYLADLVDMLRLNDITGLPDVTASIVPDMRHRTRIARAASPFWLIDSDNWPCSSMVQWREYIEAQATGEFGVPSLYHAERLAWCGTDEALQEADYALLRQCWTTHRQRVREQG